MRIVVDVAGLSVDVNLVRQAEGGVALEIAGGRCQCGAETFTGSQVERLLAAADATEELTEMALAESGAE